MINYIHIIISDILSFIKYEKQELYYKEYQLTVKYSTATAEEIIDFYWFSMVSLLPTTNMIVSALDFGVNRYIEKQVDLYSQDI